MNLNKNNLTKKEKEKMRKNLDRKIKIICWLIPRFHKGISRPDNYKKLIGESGNYD